MKEKLWGENYYNPKEKKWKNFKEEGEEISNAFLTFIFNPICRFINVVRSGDKDSYLKMATVIHL